MIHLLYQYYDDHLIKSTHATYCPLLLTLSRSQILCSIGCSVGCNSEYKVRRNVFIHNTMQQGIKMYCYFLFLLSPQKSTINLSKSHRHYCHLHSIHRQEILCYSLLGGRFEYRIDMLICTVGQEK